MIYIWVKSPLLSLYTIDCASKMRVTFCHSVKLGSCVQFLVRYGPDAFFRVNSFSVCCFPSVQGTALYSLPGCITWVLPELLRDGPVVLFTIVPAFMLSTNTISSEFIHASTSLRKVLNSLKPGNGPRAAFQEPLLKYNSTLTISFEVCYLGFLNQTNL